MNSTEFKTKLSDNKNFLTGKVLTISLITKKGITKLTFTKLKEFGLKVLELETLGAGFGFSTVENDLTTKRILTDKEFSQWSKRGVWSKITITASLI